LLNRVKLPGDADGRLIALDLMTGKRLQQHPHSRNFHCVLAAQKLAAYAAELHSAGLHIRQFPELPPIGAVQRGQIFSVSNQQNSG